MSAENKYLTKYNGMATFNGIIFEGDGCFVKAYRKSDTIILKGRTLPTLFGAAPRIKKIPVLRVLLYMIEAFFIRPIYLLDWAYVVMLIFVFALTILTNTILGLLNPLNLSETSLTLIELGMTFFNFGTVFLFFRYSGIAVFHAAEHKTSNYYEAMKKKGEKHEDVDFSLEKVQSYSRIHPRCGTNLLFPVLLMTVLFSFLTDSFLIYILALLFSIEMISWAARRPGYSLSRYILTPGLWLQRFTTRECSIEEIKIGVLAFRMLLFMKINGITYMERVIKRSDIDAREYSGDFFRESA